MFLVTKMCAPEPSLKGAHVCQKTRATTLISGLTMFS
jgi:hypothetical protein